MDNNLASLLSTSPTTLAAAQHKALKAYVLERLAAVVKCVQTENYAGLDPLVEFSPAGDGNGCDNHYISFPVPGNSGVHPLDIKEVADWLQKLAAQSNTPSKGK